MQAEMHCLHPESDGDIKRMLSTPPRVAAERRFFLLARLPCVERAFDNAFRIELGALFVF